MLGGGFKEGRSMEYRKLGASGLKVSPLCSMKYSSSADRSMRSWKRTGGGVEPMQHMTRFMLYV